MLSGRGGREADEEAEGGRRSNASQLLCPIYVFVEKEGVFVVFGRVRSTTATNNRSGEWPFFFFIFIFIFIFFLLFPPSGSLFLSLFLSFLLSFFVSLHSSSRPYRRWPKRKRGVGARSFLLPFRPSVRPSARSSARPPVRPSVFSFFFFVVLGLVLFRSLLFHFYYYRSGRRPPLPSLPPPSSHSIQQSLSLPDFITELGFFLLYSFFILFGFVCFWGLFSSSPSSLSTFFCSLGRLLC